MNDLFEYLVKRISNDEIKRNKLLFYCETREIMQEIILPALAETDFFENNAFLGGTAIRMLHGLKRYSEDLDFTMKENKIEDFSWKKYTDYFFDYFKKYGVIFTSEERNDKFGNKVVCIKSDSLAKMLDRKNIVPNDFTKENNRKKITIKLETNFSSNRFSDEIITADNFLKCNVRAFDLPSLFAGKINACLTRQTANSATGETERTDKGRDWYDLVWYINKGVSPNYDFLSSKLDYKGPFEGKHINADYKWVKNELVKRAEVLDYNTLNLDIASITLNDNRIKLDKELLNEKLNMFDRQT